MSVGLFESVVDATEPCTGGYGCGVTYTVWSCRRHSIGCTCQHGPMTPSWYRTVATCPLHSQFFDSSQTPQWWIDGEARGWRAPVAPKRRGWFSRRAPEARSAEERNP